MRRCFKCKEELPEKAKYCPACGEKVETKKEGSKEINDIEENKGISVFSYLGPLALIPYFLAKDSKFARYHAIQGLNMLFVWVPYIIIYNMVAIIGALNVFSHYGIMGRYSSFNGAPGYVITMLLLSFIGLAIAFVSVLGIIDVIQGKTRELPLVGKIKVIK